MYLKSMELHGFKSFPDKTVLNFERGVTVVVGPNGSGKSNISDAMRWVLGEISSKNIRGTRMEDVIFGGANSRAPMGYAEVSVTFDNSPESGKIDYPGDEITVTRRYYRAGESEYYINRKAVRLKDIHELFMSTGIGREGYSIIGQGKIAEILSRKSEERRNIFEEAAGISKYRYKKQETERRLASAEDNIVRINDIFGELEARIGPLEKDAEKARKYLEYYEQKKKADVSLWLYDTESMRTQLAKAEENFRLAENELAFVSEALGRLEEENERVYENAQNNKRHSEHLWNEVKSHSEYINSLDSDFRVAENNILHYEERIRELEVSCKGKEEQIKELKDSLSQTEEKLEGLKLKLSESEELRLDAAVNQQKLAESAKEKEILLESELQKYRKLDAEKTELRVRLSVIQNAADSDSIKNDDITAEISKYKDISEKLLSNLEAANKTADEYRLRLDDIESKLNETQNEITSLIQKISEKQKEYGNLQINMRSLEQKTENLKRMEEHFEGYSGGVRYVMRAYEKKEIRGVVYGPLSKLIKTDGNYVTAVETALGASIQNIVVEDESTAKAAIYALKSASAGRATFYPLTSMKANEPTPDMLCAKAYRGFIAFANELVECEEKFKKIVSSQLGRTVVFDNIENASEMAKALKYGIRVVTLDGQQINVGGSFTGGSQKRDSGMLTRAAEIERMTAEHKEVQALAVKCEAEIKEAEKRLDEVKRKHSEADGNKSVLDALLRNELSSIEVIESKLATNKELLLGIEDDFKKLSEQKEQYARDGVVLKEKIENIEGEQLEITLFRDELEIERNSLVDEISEITEKISELMISEAQRKAEIEAARITCDSYRERIAFAENEIKELSAQKDKLNSDITEKRNSIGENREKITEAEKKLEALNSERSRVDEDGLALEKRLTELRVKIKEKTGEKEVLFRSFTVSEGKLSQLKIDTDKMVAKIWDDYELTHTTALELGYPEVTAQTRSAVAAVQTEYKNKLRALGSVNVGAIEEYADVRSRYDSMKLQLEDLEETKKDLSKIISQLENEMRVKFIETFNTVNTNFNEVFGELFGGGNAEIVLTEPEDVLNSGIEIKAAPPGKIIKNLSLLSGGEQAFVAIALFFAILKHSPTPFSILDEIEAALDEVNVDRFAEYVRKYSLETQFILITHRRGTMDVADRLYGVTMPQKGISRVLTVNVNEIEKFKKDMLS